MTGGINNGPHGGLTHQQRTTAMATATTQTIAQQAEALMVAMEYDLPDGFEQQVTAMTAALTVWEPPTAVIEGRITGASLMVLRENPDMRALNDLRNDVQGLLGDDLDIYDGGNLEGSLEALRTLITRILGIEE